VLKVIKDTDLNLLKLIVDRGPVKYDIAKEELGEDYKLTLTRCRARSLVIPTHMEGTAYKLDISPFGKDVLDAWNKRELDKKLKSEM
jgi:hypothetical protein